MNLKRNGEHLCRGCGKKPPQCSPDYWTPGKKSEHGDIVRQSNSYREAIARRDTSGEKNSMFGRKHTEQTRQKMSHSRTGKVGTSATAWKGGKCSVVRRVKGIVHGRYDWYYRVYQRDGWQCVECGVKEGIDAHHVEPVNQIIRRLCQNKQFQDDDEKVLWLIEQPEIIDPELKNGVTLCRAHHKLLHLNWGSHHAR